MKFKVWEAYTETRICYRYQEIEADSRQDAMELAQDCNESPDRKSDEEYGPSGFYIVEEGEPEADDPYWKAYERSEAATW